MSISRGEATLCSLALPGLGHVLLGRTLRGAVAFVVTVGFLLAGFSMLFDRVWHCGVDLHQVGFGSAWRIAGVVGLFFGVRWIADRTRVGSLYAAVVLLASAAYLFLSGLLVLPEMLAAGPFVVLKSLVEVETPEQLRAVRLPREGEHLAMLLTGFAGVMSALWASDAWWIATGHRARRVSPSVAAAVTWILPGAGHVMAGQRSKGLLVGAAVLVMFVAGLALGEGHSVDRAATPVWWIGQVFCGVGTAFAAFVTAPMQMDGYPEMLDLGIILCTVAGLMNVMVMTDAFAVAAGDTEAKSDSSAESSAESGAEVAT